MKFESMSKTLLQIAQRADEGEEDTLRVSANSRAKNGKPQSVSEGRSKYSQRRRGQNGGRGIPSQHSQTCTEI